MKISRLPVVAGVFALAFVLPACGDPLAPISVDVKVNFEGAPVQGATITLMPKDTTGSSKGGRVEAGQTNDQGIAKVGGPKGQYKVVIKKTEATSMGSFDPNNKAMIDKMRGNMPKGPAKAGAPVNANEPKNLLPAKYASGDSGLTLTIPPEKSPVEFNLTK